MFANAEQYERFMGRWSCLLASRLLEFINLPDDGQVLDAGSGTGSLSFAISQLKTNVHVVGIDPSKEFVAFANDRNSFPDRIRFEIGDAQHLSFADSTFRSSLSLLVFNFIPDALRALQELRRVTEPGGIISAAVWDYGGEMRMLRTFWDAASSIDDRARNLDERHMQLCLPGELAVLWKQGGLENVQERPMEVQTRFESFQDYWDPFLLGQGPAGMYARTLGAGALQRLRDDLRHRLAPAGEDVSFVLRARAWAVSGTVPIAG